MTPGELRARMEAVKAVQAERSLWRFLRDYAWPVLQPCTPFVDNWHVHAICEHLEALSRGEIKRLVINVPFRMLKSTIISRRFLRGSGWRSPTFSISPPPTPRTWPPAMLWTPGASWSHPRTKQLGAPGSA